MRLLIIFIGNGKTGGVKLSEKRFTLQESDIYNRNDVIFDKGIELPQSTACDLLNELLNENNQIKEDLRIVLPIIFAIDFKISISECKAVNRLCKLVEDDFIVGLDCDLE